MMRALRAALTSPGFGQFVKFNLVGLLNTAVDFLVFTLLVRLSVYDLAAQCVSYGAGMLNSYAWNRRWTFAGVREPRRVAQAVRFIVLNGLTLLLSLVLLWLLRHAFGPHPVLYKLGITAVTTVLSFAGSKLWVFRTARGIRQNDRA